MDFRTSLLLLIPEPTFLLLPQFIRITAQTVRDELLGIIAGKSEQRLISRRVGLARDGKMPLDRECLGETQEALFFLAKRRSLFWVGRITHRFMKQLLVPPTSNESVWVRRHSRDAGSSTVELEQEIHTETASSLLYSHKPGNGNRSFGRIALRPSMLRDS